MTALRVLGLWLVCLLVSWAPPLLAEDAQAAFTEARQKWDAGDFQAALPLFEQALQASGSPNARFYVARCLRDIGRLDEAYHQMKQTVDDARRLAETETHYAATRDAAAAELAMLEPRVGKLIIALHASLEGAGVTLDGKPVPPERVGVPIAIMPGDVTVVAQAGTVRASESTRIAAGETKTLTLIANNPDTAPVPVPAAAAEPTPDDTGGFGVVRGIGIGVAAIGVGGMVMFAVGSAIADDKLAELEAACGGPCPDASHEPTIDDGKRAETLAAIGLGVGIAGIVAGTLMIVFGGADDDSSVGFSPGGLRVSF